MLTVSAAAQDLAPAPEPDFRARLKADREKFDREMKSDTKRPWDGMYPGRVKEREPDPRPARPTVPKME